MSHIHRSGQRIIIPTDVSVTEAMLLASPEPIPEDKIIFEESDTGRTVTHGNFKTQVKRTAAWLKQHLNLVPGDVVTIISSSCIDYIVATHAVWWLGGVVSMINDALSPKDMAWGLDLVQPQFVIVGAAATEKLSQSFKVSSHSSAIRKVVTIGKTPSYPGLSDDISGESLSHPEHYSLRDSDNRQLPAAIVLSSGTTGRSKAVVLSHHNLIAANYQLRADNADNWRSNMREVFFPPLSHVYATYVVMTGAPWLGYFVCIMPRFDLGRFCQLLSERKATMARLVPPVAKMLAESPITRRFEYPDLEYFTCSAAPLSEETAEKLRKTFPHVALGQSECPFLLTDGLVRILTILCSIWVH